jgi:2-oxoacid:acceptor oxidoreductase gamma subunit (pyruvate/2-ketoisovalerate family)
MLEITVKGRGGQGAKTFIEILARAANYEGKFFLAYPEFGPERSGTPINAYFKMDSVRIRDREPIKSPDIIAVLDSSIPKYDKEIKKKGKVIINSEFDKKYHFIDATTAAKKFGSRPNMAILGALIRLTGIIKRESAERAIKETFIGDVEEANLNCFREGFSKVK